MKVNCFVGIAVFFANLAAFITGLYIGGFNGALEMEGFKDTFSHLHTNVSSLSMRDNQSSSNQTRECNAGNGASSDSLTGLTVSSSNFGSFLGSLMAGWLSDKFGRKYGLSFGGLLLLLGTAALSASYFLWLLIIGRLVTGIAVGIFYMVMPVYISEMAPKESRGMLGSTIGFSFNFGLNAIFLANVGFSKFSSGWRVSIAVVGVFALVLTVGMAVMPHTPRWLMRNGRNKEALLVLSKINHSSSKETFVDTLIELEALREANSKGHMRFFSVFKDLYQQKYRLLLGSTLLFLTSSTGAFIFYYSSTVLCEVGVSPFLSSLVVGLVLLLASIVLTLLANRFGRRSLLLLGSLVDGLMALGIGILVHLYDSPSEAIGYTIVVLICIYAFTYSSSWMTLPWVVNSEIFPLHIRGVTVAITSGVFWIGNTVMNQVIPLIVGSPLQLHGFVYIITGLNLLCFIVVFLALPETKGVSLEEMDELLSQRMWGRVKTSFKFNATFSVVGSKCMKPEEDFKQEMRDTESRKP